MKNYLFEISYNGQEFCGWAPQPGCRSIISEIQNAFKDFYSRPVKINGSGRTDKGVHAIAQMASMHLDLKFGVDTLKSMLNKRLPNSIRIMSIKIIADDFHARFNAVNKTYLYVIETSKFNVFEKDIRWQVSEKLDKDLMMEAAQHLIGEHDFTSYCGNSEGERKTHIREVGAISMYNDGTKLCIEITGSGFLRYMVRKIIGTLKMVGNSTISPEDVKEILDAKNRRSGVYMAPACGLYLKQVKY